MKNEFQMKKRFTIAWLIAGIVAFFVLTGLIFSVCETLPLLLLCSLIPIGTAALTVAWRLTVKTARTVSSVLFLLLTLAVLALVCVLIFLIMLTLSLNPIQSVLPLCTLVCLIVWYVLFFILRKHYSHLIGLKESPDDV